MARPVSELATAFLILIFLGSFLLWMEWKRGGHFKALRVTSLLLVMIAVAGFLFRPHYKTSRSDQVILLTPRYGSAHVDSLLTIYPELSLFHTPGTKPFKDSRALPYHGDLRNRPVAFIVGQGLSAATLDAWELEGYQYISASYPYGITRLSFPEEIFARRKVSLEGVYHSAEKTMLYLEGPGGREDSTAILPTGNQHFTLSFVPKQPGNFLYALYAGDSLQGRLPVRVQKEKALHIFFVLHYPTFETRHLKNFLAEDHRLMLRYQLSRNRYRYEFINRNADHEGALTKASLSEFDLIIIDSDALQSLSAYERKNLQSAIDEGLGMLALFNSHPSGVNGLSPLAFKRHRWDTAHVPFEGGRKHILPAWPAVEVSGDVLRPVVTGSDRVLSGFRYKGMGKIGYQLLQETYRLALQGDSTDYRTLWGALLENTSRVRETDFAIHPKTPFPYFVDEPISVEIISSGNIPSMSVNHISLPLKEDLLLDDVWEGTFWLDTEGWNRLVLESDSTRTDLFLSAPGEWSSLTVANTMDETRARAGESMIEKKLRNVYEPVPAWIFFMIFLCGSGILWLTPRL